MKNWNHFAKNWMISLLGPISACEKTVSCFSGQSVSSISSLLIQGRLRSKMNRCLHEEGVLTQHRESRAATKKIKGQRYLELNLARLKAASPSY